jgi:hypothetical protein
METPDWFKYYYERETRRNTDYIYIYLYLYKICYSKFPEIKFVVSRITIIYFCLNFTNTPLKIMIGENEITRITD